MRNSLFNAGVPVLLAAALAACSPPPPGTQYWKQVNREYQSKDYADTLAYLDEVLRTRNDFTERASALKVTLLGALTRADLEIEQACWKGIYHVAEWDSKFFKTCTTQYRRQAKVHTLALLEALNEFEEVTSTSDTVLLDFPLPEAGVRPNSVIGRIGVGVIAVDKVFEPAVVRTVDRHIILQATDLIAASEAPKALEAFETPPVTVPKTVFLVGVAQTLEATAEVFEPGRLDDSRTRSVVLKRARECLEPALAGGAAQPQAKALAKEIAGKLRQ